MKRRQLLAIFTALAVSLCSATLLVGCAGKTVYYTDVAYDANGKPIPAGTQVSLVSTNEDGELESTAGESSTASTAESSEAPAESSEAPAESSEAPAESSAEPAESSEAPAESSEAPAESSAEASSEAPAAGIVISFQKPTDGKWADNNDVCAYVYNDNNVKNADWPGEAMTDNGDGTFSYTVPEGIENAKVIFNCREGKTQYPRSAGLDVESGKTYVVE